MALWEMFSYGFQPWAAQTGQQILEAIDEPNFQRLEQPLHCPKEYYAVMTRDDGNHQQYLIFISQSFLYFVRIIKVTLIYTKSQEIYGNRVGKARPYSKSTFNSSPWPKSIINNHISRILLI